MAAAEEGNSQLTHQESIRAADIHKAPGIPRTFKSLLATGELRVDGHVAGR